MLNRIKSLSKFFILGSLCLITGSCSQKPIESVPPKPVFVKFEAVTYQPISQEFETAGELKADKEIVVAAERQGQVEEIFVSEGSWIGRGAALVKIKGEDVDADLKLAKADYDVYKKLFDEGAISKQEFLRYQIGLEKTSSLIDNLLITAITDGTIGEIYVDPGDYVNMGDPILELVKVYPLRVTYSIPEKLIPLVSLGQPVELSSEAFPNIVFNAVVSFISPSVDQSNRAIMVRATVTNPNKLLKANQFMNIKQTIQNKEDSLLVREEAIYIDQGQEYLFIAKPIAEKNEAENHATKKKPANQEPQPTHIAERVAIKTGLRKPGFVEIIEGVNEGDLVIYAGLTGIYPGAKLVHVTDDE